MDLRAEIVGGEGLPRDTPFVDGSPSAEVLDRIEMAPVDRNGLGIESHRPDIQVRERLAQERMRSRVVAFAEVDMHERCGAAPTEVDHLCNRNPDMLGPAVWGYLEKDAFRDEIAALLLHPTAHPITLVPDRPAPLCRGVGVRWQGIEVRPGYWERPIQTDISLCRHGRRLPSAFPPETENSDRYPCPASPR